MLIAVLTPSLQPGLESCFAGVAVPQELSSGPSLAIGESRQQLHPQPFCNLRKSLTIVSLAMLKGARPPELALVWRVGAALRWGAVPRHCGTMEGVCEWEGWKGEKLVAVPPNCSPTSVLE